jgi:putative ABC transport system permease protein
VTGLWRDLRYSARLWRRQPGFTAVVLLTVALGTGATTAVFSLADWVLLRPLPGTRGADRVVTVELRSPEDRLRGLSTLNLVDLGAAIPAFSSVAGWQLQLMQLLPENGPALQVFSEAVAGDYFGVMGARPRLGRGIQPEEAMPGQQSYSAVISSDLWKSMFHSDPRIIGKVMQANKHRLTIVGVGPDGFRGGERLGRIDVWVPASIGAALRHAPNAAASDGRKQGSLGSWAGRLAPGATLEQAQAQLAQALPRLEELHPEDNEGFAELRTTLHHGVGLSSGTRESLDKAVRILAIVVALVLVIACANVANMLLFRGVARRGEAAVRRALGATGGRLLRQQIAEGLVLALAGGVLGLLVAYGFKRVFQSTRLEMIELANVPLDTRVFAFALLVSAVTGLLFGLVPTALARRLDMTAALREAGTRETGRRTYVRSAITVVQLSLSLALLVGAILLTRTLLNYYAIQLGYDTRLVAFTIDMQPQAYAPERRRAFEDQLFETIRATPEFGAAAMTQTPPFAGFYGTVRILHPERGDTVSAVGEWISPGYFETLRAEILSGRPLGAEDMRAGSGLRNVVVSEALARRLFGDGQALGRTFRLASRTPGELRVVGVAANKRVRNLTGDPETVLYEPYDAPSRMAQYITVVVRSQRSVPETEAVMRRLVDGLDPALPLMYVERLSDKLARVTAEQRLFARLLISLAAVALLMAAVGLYAVIAYSVAARTREIGIRMALGAGRRRVFGMVLKQAGALAAVGIVLGIGGALFVSRLVESRLYGVERLDPAVYVTAAALFAVIALVAAAAPTHAASRVEPTIALRHE